MAGRAAGARVLHLAAALCAMVLLGGCADTTPTRRFPVPTLTPPTFGTTPAGPSRNQPGPSSPSAGLRARYPLTLVEAQNYAGLGYPVAGLLGSGEIRVQRLSTTEWESGPVTENVCKERWDALEGRYEYRCEIETVSKRRPVQKTRFWVSGAGAATVSYDTVSQAFARIAPTDYWRRLS